MNCQELEHHIPDFLVQALDPDVFARFQQHLAECAACRSEVEELCQLWTRLEVIPAEQPSPGLRSRFYAQLEAERSATEEKAPTPRLLKLAQAPWMKFAAAAVLAAGVWTLGQVHGRNQALQAALERVAMDPREQLDPALLKKADSSKRMLGLTLISRLSSPDPSLAEDLIDLMENDPSVQVRLAAVNVLYYYSDHEPVRRRVSQAFFTQTSPLVQLALVDLLADLQDEESFETLQRIVRAPGLLPEVRERALTTLSNKSCNLSSPTEYSLYPIGPSKNSNGPIRRQESPSNDRKEKSSRPGDPKASEPRLSVPWYVTYFSNQNT